MGWFLDLRWPYPSPYAWAQYSSKKKSTGGSWGPQKSQTPKMWKKTTLEKKKKKPLKKRERISDHPGSSMSNKLTNSPSPVRSTDLFDAEPSIPIAVQSQEPQRSLALERRSTGNQWKPMVVYAVLPTQPGRVSSNLSFQLGRSFGKNPATHLPVLLLKTTLRPSIWPELNGFSGPKWDTYPISQYPMGYGSKIPSPTLGWTKNMWVCWTIPI